MTVQRFWRNEKVQVINLRESTKTKLKQFLVDYSDANNLDDLILEMMSYISSHIQPDEEVKSTLEQIEDEDPTDETE